MTLRILVLAAALAALVGCGSDTPQATAKEEKAFSGGPMPADWKAKMSASQGNKTKGGKP